MDNEVLSHKLKLEGHRKLCKQSIEHCLAQSKHEYTPVSINYSGKIGNYAKDCNASICTLKLICNLGEIKTKVEEYLECNNVTKNCASVFQLILNPDKK